MATKKTSEKKKTTKKKSTRKDPVKKEAKKETKPKEEVIETPIPEAVVEELEYAEDEMKRHKEMNESPTPDPEPIDLHAETNVAKAIPEKLETLVIDEDIEKAKGGEEAKEALGVITTSDLPPKPKPKAAKPHDPANDVMITTADLKPRKWRDCKKL